MPDVDLFDKGKKLNNTEKNNLSKYKFNYWDTTKRRKFDQNKPTSSANREKCVKQELVRDKDNNIIGLKSFWTKV